MDAGYLVRIPRSYRYSGLMFVNSAVWFKVDQAGMDYTTGQWAAIKLIADNSQYSFKVPSGLANGQYIIRHGMSLNMSYSIHIDVQRRDYRAPQQLHVRK